MKNRICFLAISWANLGLWSCQDHNPMSPEFTGSKEKAAVENTAAHVNYMVDYSQAQIVDPGKQFVDEKGVLHIRDQVLTGAPITGDLIGKNKRTLLNADINIATGNGRVFGTYTNEIKMVNRNFFNVLEGEYEAEVIAGALSEIRITHASGDFVETKITKARDELTSNGMVLKFNSALVETKNAEQ